MPITTLLVAAAITVFLLVMVQQGKTGTYGWAVIAFIIVLWLVVLIVLLSPILGSLGRV